MKRITVMALITLASALGTGNGWAQSHEVRAAVPFDFTVGNKTLPAGSYSIRPVMDGAIEIQNREMHIAVLSQASGVNGGSANDGKLVFNKYASQYFLREILCNSAALNVTLPATKNEKRARARTELDAKLHNGDGGQVLVAIR